MSPPNELRVYFHLELEQPIATTDRRRFVANTDYWVVDASTNIQSLDPAVPIEHRLRLVGGSVADDPVRMLHYAVSYPWDAIEFDVGEARGIVQRGSSHTTLWEEEAVSFGYASIAELVARGLD